jgi:hypothetical protein
VGLLDQLQDLQDRMRRVEEALFGSGEGEAAPLLPPSRAEERTTPDRDGFFLYSQHRHGRKKYFTKEENGRPLWSDNRDEAASFADRGKVEMLVKLYKSLTPTAYSNPRIGLWKEK